MKVEINIDESQFKEVLEGELKNLSKETIQDIIVESIREYFQQNNFDKIENLFFNKRSTYYDSKHANEILEGIINDCDYSKLQNVVDAAIDNLINNNEHILKDLLFETMASRMIDSYMFRERIKETMYSLSNS